MKPLRGKRGKGLDRMRPWPLSIACTLEHNKKIHKKTKRMAAVRERSKLEKEGLDKKKPRQSKQQKEGVKNKEKDNAEKDKKMKKTQNIIKNRRRR